MTIGKIMFLAVFSYALLSCNDEQRKRQIDEERAQEEAVRLDHEEMRHSFVLTIRYTGQWRVEVLQRRLFSSWYDMTTDDGHAYRLATDHPFPRWAPPDTFTVSALPGDLDRVSFEDWCNHQQIQLTVHGSQSPVRLVMDSVRGEKTCWILPP